MFARGDVTSLLFLSHVSPLSWPHPSAASQVSGDQLLGESLGAATVLLRRQDTRGRARLEPALTGVPAGRRESSAGAGGGGASSRTEPQPTSLASQLPGPCLCPCGPGAGVGVLVPLLQELPFGPGSCFENCKTLVCQALPCWSMHWNVRQRRRHHNGLGTLTSSCVGEAASAQFLQEKRLIRSSERPGAFPRSFSQEGAEAGLS